MGDAMRSPARGAGWPVWGAAAGRRRGWWPRWRADVVKRTDGLAARRKAGRQNLRERPRRARARSRAREIVASTIKVPPARPRRHRSEERRSLLIFGGATLVAVLGVVLGLTLSSGGGSQP